MNHDVKLFTQSLCWCRVDACSCRRHESVSSGVAFLTEVQPSSLKYLSTLTDRCISVIEEYPHCLVSWLCPEFLFCRKDQKTAKISYALSLSLCCSLKTENYYCIVQCIAWKDTDFINEDGKKYSNSNNYLVSWFQTSLLHLESRACRNQANRQWELFLSLTLSITHISDKERRVFL